MLILSGYAAQPHSQTPGFLALSPTTTGEPGGKETGEKVTHYILPGGPYADAFAKLKAKGFQLHWQSAPAGKNAKAKKASKTKFTCPDCGQNAWAKPDALLICGVCFEDSASEICLMLAEPTGPSRESLPKLRSQRPRPMFITARKGQYEALTMRVSKLCGRCVLCYKRTHGQDHSQVHRLR